MFFVLSRELAFVGVTKHAQPQGHIGQHTANVRGAVVKAGSAFGSENGKNQGCVVSQTRMQNIYICFETVTKHIYIF